jgi:hypothetical protein
VVGRPSILEPLQPHKVIRSHEASLNPMYLKILVYEQTIKRRGLRETYINPFLPQLFRYNFPTVGAISRTMAVSVVLLVSLVATLGGFLLGYDIGVVR